MSELPSYNIEISRQAAADVANVKSAEAMHREALTQENQTEDKTRRLQEIMNSGFVGKLLARSEHKRLKADLVDQWQENSDGSNGHRKAWIEDNRVVNYGKIRSPHTAVKMAQAKNEASMHYAQNEAQYYDNAVVEANADFTNRGSSEQIITPGVLQDQADTAHELTAKPHQAPISQLRPPQAS